MHCAHCCFSCTSKGSDITQARFDKTLELVSVLGEGAMITVGGGEPTLHKRCMDFIWQAIRACFPSSYDIGMSAVGIVTNGSVRKSALAIARLAEEGLVSARLSYDAYHDTSMVSQDVLRAFQPDRERPRKDKDNRSVNPYSYSITPHGRALESGLADHPFIKETDCCCAGLFVSPDGTIWQCGCREHKAGHVDNLPAFLNRYYAFMSVGEKDDLPCSKKDRMP